MFCYDMGWAGGIVIVATDKQAALKQLEKEDRLVHNQKTEDHLEELPLNEGASYEFNGDR